MKKTGLFAGVAVAALGFAASAQEAVSSAEQAKDTSQREVRLAICAFGTAETMVPVEEWLGKTIHPGQYAAGLPSLPQLGENKEHNAGSVNVEWSTKKLEVTRETDMIQAENQRNRKLLNDIRLKVLNDPSRRYVPLAVGYLESALFAASKGAIRMVDLEKADGGTRLVTVSLGDREEQSKVVDVNETGAKAGVRTFRQPYVGKVRDLNGNILLAFDGVGGIEMVNQRHFRILRIEKQVLDRALALAAFVMLSPFFVVVPVLVKLTSRGPVFYRQSRLGKRGRPIRVWKFRSMYADADERLKAILDADPVRRAEWEANFKLADDPRVTPLGKFLRRTSIDEFPQLFNVFAGDMALVGPRPIVEKEVPFYGPAYETFSSVKPGITGLWQASGRSDTDYARRVALDVHYVLNWSPWMDVWILFRTVYAVVFMRGAR